MAIGRLKQMERFARLCHAVLGRNPDEYGLAPDENGYVRIKDFLQAVTELEGWRHVRKDVLSEMMLSLPDPPVEMEDARIRARDRSRLPQNSICDRPPRLIYTCVTAKSYPAVLEKGIHPTHPARVICWKDPETARKVGRRRSPEMILLTVHPEKLRDQGCLLWSAGEHLFFADFIPPTAFSGPLLSKTAAPEKKSEKTPDPVALYRRQAEAGTFNLSLEPEKIKPAGKRKGKDNTWKHDKKRLRKEKTRIWPDQ